MPWDTLGDMFSQTGLAVDSANAAANPPQAPEPQQQINTGSWTDMFQPPSPRAAQLVGTFGNIALGGLAAGAGQFPQFQRQQMAWQEMALRQQEQAIRNKQQAAQMAGTLADIMHSAPGYRKDLITAYARAAGVDPKDPNIQEIASLASKMDTQDAQGMAEALRMLGVQVDNPGQLFSALKDPALRVQFFKQLEAQKQSATVDDIIKQYPPTPPPGSNNVTPQGAPLPGNEGQIPPTTAQARLQYLNKEQQRLGQMYGAVSRAAPGSQMAKDINTAIDNVRAEIGQIQGQINTEATQASTAAQRDFTNELARGNQELRRQGMEFNQQMALLARQDRLDRQATAADKPLDATDRQAIDAMEANLRAAQEIKAKFTPAEIRKYAGIINKPMQEVAQFFRDPNSPEAQKYAEFKNLSNQVKAIAFQFGGKNLTKLEAQIAFGQLPVGDELNMANYVANLDNLIKNTPSRIKRRIELATTPRSQVQSETPARKAPTRADIEKALKNAGGDKFKAAQLLGQQGFDLSAEVQ